MARCPFAEWKPIAANSSQPTIKPVGLVLHTAVSNSNALRPWSNIEWTFYVGKNGELTQFMDTTVRADCQRDGNSWVKNGVRYGFLSVETWDGAGVVWDGKNTAKCPRWTDAQVKTLAKLGAWLHDTHGIELIKATAPQGKGIGWHAQFTSSTFPRWNANHACPAAQRIAQFPSVLKAMQDAANSTPEDDMPLTDAEIKKIAHAVWAEPLDPGPFAERVGGYEPGKTYTPGGLMFGADSGWKIRDAIDKAFAKLPATVSTAVRAAAAEFGVDLTAEQLEQLAGRTADLTTQELIGAVVATKNLPGQPAADE